MDLWTPFKLFISRIFLSIKQLWLIPLESISFNPCNLISIHIYDWKKTINNSIEIKCFELPWIFKRSHALLSSINNYLTKNKEWIPDKWLNYNISHHDASNFIETISNLIQYGIPVLPKKNISVPSSLDIRVLWLLFIQVNIP